MVTTVSSVLATNAEAFECHTDCGENTEGHEDQTSSDEDNSAADEYENSIRIFKIHQYILLGWLSLFVILVGIVGNMFSLIVLSQKQMLKYTINKYLICLSLSDLMSLSIISILIPLRYILVSHRVFGFFEFHAFVFPYLYPLATTFQLSSIFLTMAACVYRTIKVYSYAPLEYLLRSTHSSGNLAGSGSGSGRRASKVKRPGLTKKLTSTNLTAIPGGSNIENSAIFHTHENETDHEPGQSSPLTSNKRSAPVVIKRFSMKNQTGKVIFSIYFVAFILCLPFWFKYRTMRNMNESSQNNYLNSSIGLNDTNIIDQAPQNASNTRSSENASGAQNENTYQSLSIIHTLVVTILSYIIPFMVLFVMNLLLIIALVNKRKRKENLQQSAYQQVRPNAGGQSKPNRRNLARSNKNESRVTFMLVMIVLLFLFCQMPNFFVHLLNVSKKVQELHMLSSYSSSSSSSSVAETTTAVIPTTTIELQLFTNTSNQSSDSFQLLDASTTPAIVPETTTPEVQTYQPERIKFINYLHQWANFLLIFNYSFNFCIYCLFNSQFRRTARSVFNLKSPSRAPIGNTTRLD